MAVLCVVRSAKQRKYRNGQCYVSRSLERAIDEARYVAMRRKQRMYVVIIRR